MRRQFVTTVESLLETDPRVVLLLGDIGVWGFRDAFAKFPDRVYNVGICEQAMIGMAAGMAKEGLIPIVHSIAPFIVERCLEQIKVDLCYQGLGANIVSVGASYDYAEAGCTHHCPGDVAALKAIPGMQIVVPGDPHEFNVLFREVYASGQPTYFRLAAQSHSGGHSVSFGVATSMLGGSRATVIAVGPMLDRTLQAVEGLDVGLLYYTTLAPFDHWSARVETEKIIVVEPFYEGTLAYDITYANERPKNILSIGVPRNFITRYGTVDQIDEFCGLTAPQIRARIEAFLDE